MNKKKKVDRRTKFEITDVERELLEALIRQGLIKKAAAVCGISESAAHQRLHRLRNRYERAKQLVEEYERYKIRLREVTSTYL